MKRILFALIATTAAAFAQGEKKPLTTAPEAPAQGVPVIEADTPEKVLARFFSHLASKNVDAAYDQLTKNTKIAERAEDVKTLKSKTKEAISVFGAMSGHEVVNQKNVGDRIVRYTVVSLGKEFPLRWRFYFYKPADAWKLIDMRVDDRLGAMFDETDEDKAARP